MATGSTILHCAKLSENMYFIACLNSLQLGLTFATETTALAIKGKDAYDLMVPLIANARLGGQGSFVTKKVSV